MTRLYVTLALAAAFLVPAAQEASAQICRPVAERTGEVGCWIIAHSAVGQLTKSEVFWHLDVFPTRAAAAEAEKTTTATVLEAFGKFWLSSIGDAGWRSIAGERLAEIGPLPTNAGQSYSAQHMEPFSLQV